MYLYLLITFCSDFEFLVPYSKDHYKHLKTNVLFREDFVDFFIQSSGVLRGIWGSSGQREGQTDKKQIKLVVEQMLNLFWFKLMKKYFFRQ